MDPFATAPPSSTVEAVIAAERMVVPRLPALPLLSSMVPGGASPLPPIEETPMPILETPSPDVVPPPVSSASLLPAARVEYPAAAAAIPAPPSSRPPPPAAPPAPVESTPEPVAAAPKPAITNPQPTPAPAFSSVANPQKENTMEATMQDAATKTQAYFGDANDRAKTAMEKSAKMFEDMNAFGKGNLEAVVESSRIAAKGFESLGQEAAERKLAELIFAHLEEQARALG